MRIVNIIAYILVIVGALNWGLFGFFNFKYVFTKEGAQSLGGFGSIGSLFGNGHHHFDFFIVDELSYP